MAASALDGIRVLDLSRVLAGPYATMMLGDLGADVIKVEGPEGDDTRRWLPPTDERGASTYFASVNRNKRAMTADLADPGDRAAIIDLARHADVLVENFRPGGMKKFGLGYQELSAVNPRLVYCSITGFGGRAAASLPGYDLLVQAVGGLMSITGQPGGDPMKVGVALVDVITGLNALAGIQAALLARVESGRGQRVEVNLLHSLLSALVNQASGALATGRAPTAMGNAHPSIAPYETFATAEGTLAIAVGNNGQFGALLDVLGLRRLGDDPRFSTNADRVTHRSELRELIEGALRRDSAARWGSRLLAEGVPAGPVNTVLEAVELAESLGIDVVVDVGEPGSTSRLVANPIGLGETPPRYRSAPPQPAPRGRRLDWI